jgi:WD40 repeat protein
MRPIVVFFAFANDRVDGARYLRNLPEELRRVRAAMAVAEKAGLCEIVERANATAAEVLDVFQNPEYRDRVAIFHFGGHAGGAGLLLESAEGRATLTHAGGLSRFLGQQRGLTLVFLNGCSTAGQVRGLLDAGVLAVIATCQVIDDAVATELSARFYQSLASGASLKTAFNEAEAAVRTRVGESARHAYRSFVPEMMDEERWPWDLHVAPGAGERFAQWSLPREARNPLFGLPDLPLIDLPPSSPFKHLDWFTRNDAWVFFGRGREIRDLYEAVTASDAAPIVLLFGETGVGKSSLLAAGLIPRLEASHVVVYLRRVGTLGLAGTLAGAFEDERRAGGNGLGAAWRAREEQTGKPLVVILDQAEEAWTRPLGGEKEEENLAAALRSIFAVPENRPRGRLILGLREEWLPKILRLVVGEALPYVGVEITPLSREAIAEVVTGPASTERLRRQYKLEVESQLASDIASDLSEDAGAAVAPTLQILLSKMWSMASEGSPGARRFTLEFYQRLKREGILLDNFLEEQLAGLREWRPDVVDSGLAIDLLAHHTTPLGTAETRQAAEVVERYGGRPEIVELLGQCKNRYLLTGTARVQEGELVGGSDDPLEKGTTRLAHDTLAPLVRRRFEASDLPGQRALRVLQQRAVGWAEGKEGALLDEVDLGIVELGAGGMPVWSPDERRLVEASRREQEARMRRRRKLRIGAAVAATAIAASAGVAWWQRGAAIESERKTQDVARVAIAGDLLEQDPTRAALVLLEVAKPDEAVSALSRLREVVETRLAEVILRGHEGSVGSAAFSPDGRRIVTASADRTARVWPVDGSGEPVVLSGHEGSVWDANFSPNGLSIVTASVDQTARVWSADGRGEPVILRGHEDTVRSAVFSPDGKQILTASNDGTARVWMADGSSGPVVLRGHKGSVWSASFSLDGRRVVTSAGDGTARVWSVDGSGEPIVLDSHGDSVWSASFSPDGQRVVTSHDGTARVWMADGSDEPLVIHGHENEEVIRRSSFSPDGRRVVTASIDGTARVWPVDGSGEPVVLQGHEDQLVSAEISPDGKLVATASQDKTGRIWLSEGSGEPQVLRGHEGPVYSASFSPDGQRVVTTSRDGTVRIWAAGDSIEPLIFRHEDWVRNAAFSPDGRRIVTASSGGTAQVWSLVGSGGPVVLRGHEGQVVSAAFSPDGRRVVTTSLDGTARVWFDGSGEPVILRGHEDAVRSAAFSPDGQRVVTTSDDRTARVWSADGSGEPVVLRGHEYRVRHAAFSPDGGRIVTTCDETVRVWASDGSTEPIILLVLRNHQSAESAVFSPDGTQVIVGWTDGTAWAWPADGSGEPVVVRGSEDWVSSMAFSPDGKRVITASDDNTVQVWSADTPGDSVVLHGHGSGRLRAAFSADGKRIVTAAEDHTARVWAISGTLLQALVRAETSECLEPKFRVPYLGETTEEAQATYDRCRRCIGPWRRQFDRRSIYAAPDEAWAEWQACMGR